MNSELLSYERVFYPKSFGISFVWYVCTLR